MTDLSDGSDVNPMEMAQMVEDIDNLDRDLFGSSHKKQKSSSSISTKDSASQLAGQTRKRVVFQDFNEDDPLADLLSDEEDFKSEEKNPVRSTKSNLIENLFGVKAEDSTVTNTKSSDRQPDLKSDSTKQTVNSLKSEDWLEFKNEPLISRSGSQSHVESNIQKTKSPFINDESITNLPDASKSVDEKSKKSSIMEDLLGIKSRPSSSKELNIRTSSTRLGSADRSTPAKQSITELLKTEESPKPESSTYALSVPTPTESRRSRKSSRVIDDPLGLFSTSQPEKVDSEPTTLSKKESLSTTKLTDKNAQIRDANKKKSIIDEDLPEWLGGIKKIETEKSENKKETSVSNINTIGEPDKLPNLSKNVEVQRDIGSHIENAEFQTINTEAVKLYPEHLSMLMDAQFNEHAAITVMHQQEQELKIAAVISQQNEQLNALLNAQTSKLHEQEKQFDMLIKKQVERQVLLENQIKMQQKRIHHYMQTLMTQSSSIPISVISTPHKSPENSNKEPEQIEQLQFEKSHLENTINILNKQHEIEVMIREESYQKQISFLQESMEKLEKRMQHEVGLLEADSEAKIEKLKEEKIEMEKVYKEEIESIKKEHMQFVEEIYERQSRSIKLIQKEHSDTIANIYKAKEVEKLAIANMTTHKEDMENMLKKATNIIDTIKGTYENVEKTGEKAMKLRENYLKIQEENIEIQKQELDRQNIILQSERNKLVESTEKLDLRLSQFITEFQKKNLQYSELEEMLKAKEKALLRDRELFEEKEKWEHNHLQVLKESWLKEQERQLKALAEDREEIAAEKAKLQIFSRLKTSNDEAAKIELETTIKAAQDAIIAANQERLKWQEKTNELEIQWQHLQEKENQLMLRAKELETLTQSTLAKREEGLKALRKAQQIENQHKEKLSHLQVQLEGLAQREKKIAMEKFALVRERLALKTGQAEKPEKDITTSQNYISPHTSELQPIASRFLDIVDPHLIMLKLNLDDELSNTNEYLAAMGKQQRTAALL